MKKLVSDTSASILARLKNLADKGHLDFNLLLIRYTQERFLARLAMSPYVKNLVLKGGFLLLAYDVAKARPTKDVDFLGINIARDKQILVKIIKEIVTATLNDGMAFFKDEIKAEVIKEQAEYDGVRISVAAKIGKAKTSLRIDFAFGDVVTSGPLKMSYPTLLGKDDIKVLAYSKETIVSEKFEAIVRFTTFNTRLKDFYDLSFLSGQFAFEGQELQRAIKGTFGRRKTSLKLANELLDSYFGNQNDFERQWQAFKRRTNLGVRDGFREVFTGIRQFLLPVVEAELKSEYLRKKWNPSRKEWEGA